MQTRCRCRPLAGAFALALLLAGTIALSAQPPGLDPLTRPDPAKVEAPKDAKEAKDAKPLVVKLPDGTFLWLGGAEGERVTLTPQEYQKLLDRMEALKKELAARKPAPPSGCAIKGRVEKRGEQLVAALKITYSFRTAQANTAVSLGGRRAFLVSAALDGAKLPVLDTGEDGFAVMVESAGDHALVLDVEAPVTARGAKSEVGFDLGLPRAPITTLALAPPGGGVKRVNVTTRAPDAAQPGKAPEVRRLTGLDVKQLVAKGADAGLPLGPVDSLEVTWDPPASAAQPADQVQSAEFEVGVVLTEGFIESTAKVKFRGPGSVWKLVAPSTADVSVDRVAATGETTGPAQQPVVTKPTDSAKLVWKVEFPAGSSASDWTVTAVVRQPRPKAGAKSAAMAVGPFAALDVLRQTGTVKVTAGPYTRFVFKHGPDLRRAEPPGPADDENSVAFFRLTTGPTGATPVNTPLLSVEAWPVEGTVRVKPTYRLKFTAAGWHVRAEVAVRPIRTEVKAISIEVPAEWRGLESESDPEVVASVTQEKGEGAWGPVTVRLASGSKKPFEVVLVGTIPLPPEGREATIPLPRFPRAVERDATVTASVSEGLEVRGTARGWDGDAPTAWSFPLDAAPGANGKTPRAVTAVTGRGELGLASVSLRWQPYRPDVAADVKADVTVGERQVIVSQVIKLRSPDGLPKSVRLRGPAEALGVKGVPALDSPAAGVWSFTPQPPEAKEATLKVSFALPLPAADGPLSLPVGLLWPAEAARADAHVRVWVASAAGHAVGAPPAGWRELPPEPVPERAALPALTLASSGEHPLVLELRRAATGAGAAVRVERALIEAGMTEDGSVGYRARFRLQLSLAPVVEVALPESVGPNPAARVDGLRAELMPVEGGGVGRFRVALPEGAARSAVLELDYTLPGSRHSLGETLYRPPVLASAAYVGPVRWHVVEPSDAAPLLVVGGRAEMRWKLRGPTYAPAAATRGAMERWFASGVEPGPGDTAGGVEGEPIALRQASPEPVRVVRVPWLALVIGTSLAVVVMMIALTWLPAGASALFVVLLGGAFAVGAVLYPQPASQLAAAGQPGFALGLAALAAQAAFRWHTRRRVTYLPGFSRTPVEPSAVVIPSTASALPAAGPSSARSRPGSTGSGTAGKPAPAPSGS